MKPQPIKQKVNAPGWFLDTEEDSFFLWGPNKRRDSWSASISSEGGYSGTFAESLDGPKDAMIGAKFPDDIFKLFLDVIGE